MAPLRSILHDRPWAAALMTLAVAATGLMLPLLLSPPVAHDSFWIDLVWIEGFAEELRRGALYPRWLSGSNGGLGAPVFYFYAPLAFYPAALFRLAGFGSYGALLATAGAAWFASGAAMLAWLRSVGVGSGRRAVALALLYMALPYHVLDLHWRGALAEFCAYAVLPLVAIGIRRAARGAGLVPLAFAYAALAMTHLPTALLASLFLIGPWCIWLAWRDPRSTAPLLGGLALGLGLAAIYLVPALTLQEHVSFDQLWRPAEFRAAHWTFFNPSRWAHPAIARFFVVLTVLTALAAARPAGGGNRWAIGAIAICALVAGVVPGLWDVALLAKVQFPWRALMLAEFALVTALARARTDRPLRLLALLPLAVLTVLLLRPHGREPGEWTPQALRTERPEVLEYLPRGASRERGTYSRWALDLARRHRAPLFRAGRTIAPVFFFPAWEVRCEGRMVPASPDPQTRLLSYAGRNCAVRRGVLPAERIGAAISVLAVLLLAVGAIARRRRERIGRRPRGVDAER